MSENISPAQIQLGQRLAHNAPDQSQITALFLATHIKMLTKVVRLSGINKKSIKNSA